MADSLVGITEWMDDPSKRIEIYTAFINRAILEDADRERLKAERGFTDDIINTCHFVSCRPENKQLVEDMKDQFSEEELLDAGLLEASHKGIRVCTQLLGIYKNDQFVNNICIPYFDNDGEIFYIRPHKYGLKGKGINIYCPAHDLSPDRTWIITESEFKAAATLQFGFPVIGLPGIHSFVGKSGVNFERLKHFIESLGISKIVVIYDNEIKNNPEFSNYKPDVLKQWDTQWRAIDISRKLIRGIPDLADVRIGTLPDEWMQDGKIDIDGALAQGRSDSEFRAVVYKAQYWQDYLVKQPPIAKKIITRKIYKEDYLERSKVKKKENGYYMVRTKKVGRDQPPIEIEEQVSNFTMEIKKTLIEGTTHIREIIFRGQDGSVSKPHICNKGTNLLRDYKSWVWSCGDYHFTGKQEDLDLIWQLEGAMCDGREIQRPEMIGLLKTEDDPMWLFSNALIKEETGEFLLPDDEGIIWDGLNGYLPQSIKQEAKKKGSTGKATQIPTLSLDSEFGHAELKDVFKKMELIWGTKATSLAVGWIAACLLSDEIHRKYGCFPILFIAGKRESGKTTLAQWLLAMAGQRDTAAGSLEGTSPAAAIRHLAWFSSLPYWQDEYRNNKQVKKWDGFYRNVYNRQSTSRGTLGTGVRSPSINAGIILSGEETPEDNALMSRCVVIPLVKNKDKDKTVNLYREIENYRSQGLLSKLITEVLKVKSKILPQILEKIDGWKKRLLSNGVGDRISLNYVIPAVCYDTLFLGNESIETRKEFLKWVIEESHKTELEKENEHMLSVFMEELITIHEQLEGFYDVYTQSKDPKGKRRIAIHFPSFYSRWTEHYRRKGHEQFKQGTMKSYIREEPYFLCEKLKRVGGKPMRCMILSLDDEDNPPDGIKYLADGRAESEDSIPDAIESLNDTNDLF